MNLQHLINHYSKILQIPAAHLLSETSVTDANAIYKDLCKTEPSTLIPFIIFYFYLKFFNNFFYIYIFIDKYNKKYFSHKTIVRYT